MNLTFIRRFHEIQPGDGTPKAPSLGELMNDDFDNNNGNDEFSEGGLESDGFTLKPGYTRNGVTGAIVKDPNYVPTNNGMFPNKQQPPAAVEGLNADGTLQEGYEKNEQGQVVKKAVTNRAPVVEGVNADGTIQEGYERNPDGTVTKKAPASPGTANNPEGGDEDETTPEQFYEAVENITGRKIPVEYPEGIDPLSPEGIAHRDNVLIDYAEREFDAYIKKTNPRGYAYLMHLDAGGDDESFFQRSAGFQLPELTALQESADVQAAIYKRDLISMGNDPDDAQALVDAATKNNTLKAKSEKSWAKMDSTQKAQLAQLEENKRVADAAFTDSVKGITASITNGIKAEMSFLVPETQQAEFQRYVLDNLRYDNGKFMMVQPVGDNLKTLLESLYFQFKKGDLTTLIKKGVQTKAVQNLKLKTGARKPAVSGPSGTGNNGESTLPLSAILPMEGYSEGTTK